jgi:ribosomal protein S18 acetylase RimI-like enzyme
VPPSEKIRPAVPADADFAAELIYLPMGRLADYLFGADDPARARCVLRALFVQLDNRFSYQFADMLETDGAVAGIVLGYPASALKELAMPMAGQLRELVGVGGIFRLLKRSLPFLRIKEAENDEFYIYTLAVRPEFQSHGLGEKLLLHAEEKARTMGLQKCSLGVATNNERAVRFYQRLSYELVDTVCIPNNEPRLGYAGWHRMVKRLEPL